jgi:hypothetical protein
MVGSPLRQRRRTGNYSISCKTNSAKDAYNDISDQIQDAISNFVTESSTCDGSTDFIFRDETKSSLLKLPRIALLKFSDKFFKWENFHHTFSS